MTVDYTSKSFIDYITFDKKESRLLRKVIACKTRKCSKINKQLTKENAIFEKGLKETCPDDKNIKSWSKCLTNYTHKHGSKAKNLYNKYVKCGKKKCSKEQTTLKKYQTQLKNSTV